MRCRRPLTLLERLDIPRSERDPDLVDLGRGPAGLVELLVVVHFYWVWWGVGGRKRRIATRLFLDESSVT